jgi:hypothetical protein
MFSAQKRVCFERRRLARESLSAIDAFLAAKEPLPTAQSRLPNDSENVTEKPSEKSG